jgi:hypothetical protein
MGVCVKTFWKRPRFGYTVGGLLASDLVKNDDEASEVNGRNLSNVQVKVSFRNPVLSRTVIHRFLPKIFFMLIYRNCSSNLTKWSCFFDE